MKYKFNLIEHNGIVYLVQKTIRESHNPILSTWKEHLRSDIILKKGDYLYFCEEVSEIKEVE